MLPISYAASPLQSILSRSYLRSPWQAKYDLRRGSSTLCPRFHTQRCSSDQACPEVTCVQPRRQKVTCVEVAGSCAPPINSLRMTGVDLPRSDWCSSRRSKVHLRWGRNSMCSRFRTQPRPFNHSCPGWVSKGGSYLGGFESVRTTGITLSRSDLRSTGLSKGDVRRGGTGRLFSANQLTDGDRARPVEK